MKPIFVFGSNEAGIHGAGAALYALKHEGAKWGKGDGFYGSSYAIPTKDNNIKTLPLWKVKIYVDEFKLYAELNPDKIFKVTCIGCGLAGFTHAQIAPFFVGSPKNCTFDTQWREYLGNEYEYWGTF